MNGITDASDPRLNQWLTLDSFLFFVFSMDSVSSVNWINKHTRELIQQRLKYVKWQ